MTIALAATLIILAVAWIGAAIGQYFIFFHYLFGVILPMVAGLVFIGGIIWKVADWAKSPVPFAIPTTGGQQQSLSWIKPARLDNPFTTAGVIGRMCLEVLTFRSLFRNSAARKSTVNGLPRITYYSSKWLWVFALLFHYSMLVILVRHFRFVLEPVPFLIAALEFLDGLFQIGHPRFYLTSALILLGLTGLLGRRLYTEKLRHISLPADYFALFLLFGVVLSGIFMRYFGKVDIAAVKTMIMGIVTLKPIMPAKPIGNIFFIHVGFVSCLLMYFPFSKLTHMAGIFLSPTRNMKTNTRQERHINPWNPPKKFHTYAAYEDDFREAMFEAGLPLEKEPMPDDPQAAANDSNPNSTQDPTGASGKQTAPGVR